MAENGNDRESYKKPKRPYKVAFAGVYSVGKTSLFKRMFKLDFSEEKKPFCHPKLTHQEIFDDDKTIIPVRLKTYINFI